jgi:hypothetical protein
MLFAIAHHRASLRAGLSPARARSWGVRAGGWGLGWTATFGIAAGSGLLARFDARPPPMAFMFAAIFTGAFVFAFSRAGSLLADHLSVASLVGVQAFRLPLELVMSQAATAGVMPVQLSFHGYNFDIVTGLGAAVVALLAARGKAPRWLVMAWNVYGVACLAVIAVIAFLTAPFVRAFGEGSVNTWVAYLPFVWLPAVCVPAALALHLILFRKLGALGRRTS